MSIRRVSRREFVRLTSVASAGLILGVSLEAKPAPKKKSARHAIGAFVEIGDDNVVTIYVPHTEMGQGVRTSLPMIVAEELDADWSRVRVKQADLDAKYGDQGTGGSGSVWSRWMPLRKAGATARAMLVSAAATRWGVDAKECTVSKGVIAHGTKKLTFGEVAEAAAKFPVPKEVTLKDPTQFKIVGRKANRTDNRDIVTGKAQFGVDVRVPGMLYAVVARSPVFGGSVASFDATKAKAIAGVKNVVPVEAVRTDMPWSGVAVVGASTWAALKGREALDIKWNEGTHAGESTADLQKALAEEIVKTDVERVFNQGDVDAAFASAAKQIEADYEVPFLAHATMEPQNATALATAEGVEVWAPTQFPDWAARGVANALKIKPEQVKVHVTLAGGGFGRRINPDYVIEAALISKAVGAPVHVQWMREDDMTHDFYRPPSRHHLAGAVDADGKLLAISHRLASPAVRAYYGGPKAKNIGKSETRSLAELWHLIPNMRAEYVLVDFGTPRGWWRSVGSSSNTFVVQSFIDELARAAGKDPIDFHLALLGKGVVVPADDPDEKDFSFSSDRARGVIELVRDGSRWGSALPAGRARGFAWVFDSLTYAAEVAEVSIGKDGAPRVHRVDVAIDCGTVVNPDGVAAQAEGGVVFGLSAALYGAITLTNGRVDQSNFHDYPLLRISQMPVVETHIVPSAIAPTGTGEPPVPPIAPAVASAIFALTGKRLRKLPFDTKELRG